VDGVETLLLAQPMVFIPRRSLTVSCCCCSRCYYHIYKL